MYQQHCWPVGVSSLSHPYLGVQCWAVGVMPLDPNQSDMGKARESGKKEQRIIRFCSCYVLLQQQKVSLRLSLGKEKASGMYLGSIAASVMMQFTRYLWLCLESTPSFTASILCPLKIKDFFKVKCCFELQPASLFSVITDVTFRAA